MTDPRHQAEEAALASRSDTLALTETLRRQAQKVFAETQGLSETLTRSLTSPARLSRLPRMWRRRARVALPNSGSMVSVRRVLRPYMPSSPGWSSSGRVSDATGGSSAHEIHRSAARCQVRPGVECSPVRWPSDRLLWTLGLSWRDRQIEQQGRVEGVSSNPALGLTV